MEWISVKDRLPNEYDTVLTFRAGYTRDPAKNGIDVECMQRQPSWFSLEKWGWGITHWMPLPDPPEDSNGL